MVLEILIFLALGARARLREKKPFIFGSQLFKQREGKEEEKKSRFGTFVFNISFVWNISFGMESMEPMYGFVG